MGFDEVVWQVLTVTLTVVGLAASWLLWRRRGAAAGLRGIAWSLLPAAAYLTGTLRLLWEVGDAVVSWAVRFVFSPFVWAGIGLAVVAATLFVVAGQMRRRGVGVKSKPAAGRGRRTEALPATGDKAPATGSTGRSAAAAPGADDDMADIEAILKKHGIT